MNILIASSEVVPFSKTGGLADVCGALPIELARMKQHVAVFTPAYRCSLNGGYEIKDTGPTIEVPVGNKVVEANVLRSSLPGSNVPVFLIEHPDYFDRDELYRERGEDYRDNCERFVFFCRSILEAVRAMDIAVDVIHCNDWQTGLLPAYLKLVYRHDPLFRNTATLMTIHNLAYQGRFWHWDMLLTGIDWSHFNWNEMEFYGDLNLLKTALVYADKLNTVSKTYAKEIQTAELGCGLEGVLRHRSEDLEGIINGISYTDWNPVTDPFLASNYDADTWQQGKPLCKAALQRRANLPVDPAVPVLGLIGRLAEQKGWDLLMDVIPRWLERENAQWIILGTGEPVYHDALSRLARKSPDKIAVLLEFSNELAHQIEAGADAFLMPSRYEPCGLNQMYSLRYGTVPIVRSTGGLADTITDATPTALAAETANGFRFDDMVARQLDHAIQRACDMYRNEPATWARLVEIGMKQDFSWANSATQYLDLYKRTRL